MGYKEWNGGTLIYRHKYGTNNVGLVIGMGDGGKAILRSKAGSRCVCMAGCGLCGREVGCASMIDVQDISLPTSGVSSAT